MFKPTTVEEARAAVTNAEREYHNAHSNLIDARRVLTIKLDEWAKENYISPMTGRPSLSPSK